MDLVDALALYQLSLTEMMGIAGAEPISTCTGARLVTAVTAPANSQRLHNSHYCWGDLSLRQGHTSALDETDISSRPEESPVTFGEDVSSL